MIVTPLTPDLQKKIEQLDLQKIKSLIMRTNEVSWHNHKISNASLNRWLNNFSGEALGSIDAEQKIAAYMLLNFTYYNDDEIRTLSKLLFNEYIHTKLKEYGDNIRQSPKDINNLIAHIKKTTIFLPSGNSSESGAAILYFFRQESDLPKGIFKAKDGVTYENVVFVDDVTISGTQAFEYIKQEKDKISGINKYFLTLIATQDAEELLKHIDVKVIAGSRLSDREKCFGENSYVFVNEGLRGLKGLAYKMCEYYGDKIILNYSNMSGFPLGFNHDQQMFSFYYNTPDNTLPIFWGESETWTPLFKRYDKKYVEGGTVNYELEYV